MSRLRCIKAKRATLLVCLALLSGGLPERTAAATITNYLGDGWVQYWLNVNAGDTVVWVNEQPLFTRAASKPPARQETKFLCAAFNLGHARR